MSLTVATVALNAAEELPLTLESILGQDYPDIELLVVDGSSWDDTPEVLSRYRDDIDRLEIIEDAGIFDAMNRAAAMAGGEMVLFLNAGDLFHSADTVTRLMARRHTDADIVYGNHIYRKNGREMFQQSWDFRAAMAGLRSGRITPEWIARFPAHQATMTRTTLLREKRYDTAFRVCADHDFFLRAVEAGATPQFVDEIVAIYAGGGFSDQRHDLLKLEWNALHRRFSADPAGVDAYYYGGASPFRGTRSLAAGEAIVGLSVERKADLARAINHPYRFLSGDGARFLTPTGTNATGLQLRGTNPFTNQILNAFVDGQSIAQVAVPKGSFAVDLVFEMPLPGGTVVEVMSDHAEPFDAGSGLVSLAVREFEFSGDATTSPRPAGAKVAFNRTTSAENAELLGAGWYQFEPTFIWSRGVKSEVRLSSMDSISALVVDMRPNPVVKNQSCTISVNGMVVAEGPLSGGAISADVGHLWRKGGQDNMVHIQPSASASVGGDPRDLGVALVSIQLR
ncbi:glycosyltransferase family 2 protein [Acuticoccus sp. MNP-M23]|uniref:glycosyltransferase family 2 protein n=1 Tax=Acuticoccus sp. MNP-M23 TaxID=3072793 RepID=UPI002814EF33|nr:glycosyltransferase family 2 protein [Acuticoccus sp. MNP-M23]WMS40864.1 glycosyltransferase family 2 protein [Acuticoccus sp. MNP-M23]